MRSFSRSSISSMIVVISSRDAGTATRRTGAEPAPRILWWSAIDQLLLLRGLEERAQQPVRGGIGRNGLRVEGARHSLISERLTSSSGISPK